MEISAIANLFIHLNSSLFDEGPGEYASLHAHATDTRLLTCLLRDKYGTCDQSEDHVLVPAFDFCMKP